MAKTQINANLTVEDVTTMLEQTRKDLDAARAALPEAQRSVALSRLGVRSNAGKDPEAVRVQIAQLEDAIAGMEALLPVAERSQLLAEIATIDSGCADRQPKIDRLAHRLRVLNAEIQLLPAGVADPQPFCGMVAEKHPKVVEYEKLRAESRELEEASKYAELDAKAARRRVAEIETAHPHVVSDAYSTAS
jgi:hypothetical protein